MVHLPRTSIFGEKPLILYWLKMGQLARTKYISENLLINLIPIIHAYLHFKNKVSYQSINEILTIKEYWNLIGWEPFLAIITWEPDFSQVCSFCRMLKDHKNVRFTTTPDKAKGLIFLKSPKKFVFWPFFLTFLTSLFSITSSSVTYN